MAVALLLLKLYRAFSVRPTADSMSLVGALVSKNIRKRLLVKRDKLAYTLRAESIGAPDAQIHRIRISTFDPGLFSIRSRANWYAVTVQLVYSGAGFVMLRRSNLFTREVQGEILWQGETLLQ